MFIRLLRTYSYRRVVTGFVLDSSYNMRVNEEEYRVITTVYLDALFLLSGLIDYCLLLICGKLADVTAGKLRLLAGTVLGALYSLTVVIFFNSVFSALLTKLVASLLIVLLSYGFGRVSRFLRLWSVYIISNFTLIGSVLAIGWIRENDPYTIRFSNIVIAAVLFYVAVSLLLKRMIRMRDRDVTVEIEYCGKRCSLHALVDTGNLLRDPLSHAPVVIVDLCAVKSLFDSKTYSMLETVESENYLYLARTMGLSNRVRLIPYYTVGSKSELMLAFRPDAIFVNQRELKHALVAFSPSHISSCGEFEALVGVGEELP